MLPYSSPVRFDNVISIYIGVGVAFSSSRDFSNVRREACACGYCFQGHGDVTFANKSFDVDRGYDPLRFVSSRGNVTREMTVSSY